ncbi:hypothetical protein BDV35DRAFT_267755 [Aspergillus flavus]|uniref:Uncharacterized protein n=1 Tax=Aspergillus flavus TaxID=5059 RepID=A0A5N6GRU8_ASPFL|nr:hypothetical protein BDV35DRAFT_267755 [Aspergillus flavus]
MPRVLTGFLYHLEHGLLCQGVPRGEAWGVRDDSIIVFPPESKLCTASPRLGSVSLSSPQLDVASVYGECKAGNCPWRELGKWDDKGQ